MATIVKDTDTPIQIILTDENGDAIDLSGLAGFVVEVFQKNILFDKFSLNTQAGFRSINVTDAVNGKFEIYLNAANTSKGVVGKEIFYEVKTVAVNANFDSGTEEKSSGKIALATLVDSDLKQETFV
jgi:hypothetical protein